MCGKTGVWASALVCALDERLLDKAAAGDAAPESIVSSKMGHQSLSVSIVDNVYDSGEHLDGMQEAGRIRSTSRLSATGLTNSPYVSSGTAASRNTKRASFNESDKDFLPLGAEQLEKTMWYRIVSVTQTTWGSLLVLVLVTLCTVLIGLNAFDGKLSASLDDYLPRGSSGRDALEIISNEFSSGSAYPYKLVIEVPRNGNQAYYYNKSSGGRGGPVNVTSVIEESFFNVVQPLLEDLVSETDAERGAFPNGTQRASFLYITPGIGKVDYGIVKLALTTPSLLGPIGFYLQNMVEKEFSNAKKTAAVVEILLGTSPFSNAGRKWIVNFESAFRLHLWTLAFRWRSLGLAGMLPTP